MANILLGRFRIKFVEVDKLCYPSPPEIVRLYRQFHRSQKKLTEIILQLFHIVTRKQQAFCW